MQFLNSLQFAWKGLLHCLLHERNFRIHTIISMLTIGLDIVLKVSAIEWLVSLLCITLVLSLEILNTAIERLSDAVSSEFHPLIKIAKDVAAGAVLLVSCMSCVIGAIIFFPKIYSQLLPFFR